MATRTKPGRKAPTTRSAARRPAARARRPRRSDPSTAPSHPERLAAESLRLRFDPAALPFAHTGEIADLEGAIGQDRAVEAIRFGLEVREREYHLFVAAPATAEARSLVPELLDPVASDRPTPSDLAFVHNFAQPERPLVIELPAERGRELAKEMRKLVDHLDARVPAAMNRRTFRMKHQSILERSLEARRVLWEALVARGREVGLGVEETPQSIQTFPLRPDGTPMPREEFDAQAPELKRQLAEREKQLKQPLLAYLEVAREAQERAEDEIEALGEKMVAQIAGPRIARIRKKFEKVKGVTEYLDQVESDVVESASLFMQPDAPGMDPNGGAVGPFGPGRSPANPTERYEVNVLVDNSDGQGGPVVEEYHPTLSNLIGRLERRMNLGALETSHMLIRAGSLIRANGGFLVVEARELLQHPGAYLALKRALRQHEVVIEEPDELQPLGMTASMIRPAPVPIDVKVVLLGSLDDYLLLSQLDEEFPELFKVRADFDFSTPLSTEIPLRYARYVARVCREQGLLAVERDGIAALIEAASRIAGRQDEVTLEMSLVADLVTEAHHLAVADRVARISRRQIESALARREVREGLFRERHLREFRRGTYLVAVSGGRVGQVNGLAVTGAGDIAYGLTCRITARTYAGSAGLVNIDRESEMSGSIHSKAVLILSGYLGGTYARERPLALTASLAFEQSYALVEGDSASVAELVALLSSLVELPVRQDLAVTGSMSQHGEMQPIGGVNEKIEGFFDICDASGLTTTQGVVIPAQNRFDLNLAPRVVDAVARGAFAIWCCRHVDEALELFLGVPAGTRDARGRWTRGSLHARVASRLDEMARAAEPSPGRRKR